MRRLAAFFISLVLPLAFIAIPAALLVFGQSHFRDFLGSSEGVWPVVFERLPFVVLALAAISGWHFNQTKIGLLCLLTAGIYLEFLLLESVGLLQGTLWGLSLCIAYPVFFLSKEHRVFSMSGAVKVVFIAGLLWTSWRFQPLKPFEDLLRNPVSEQFALISDEALPGKYLFTSISEHVKGFELILLIGLLFSTLVMGMFGSNPTHRILKRSFMASLAASLLGFSGIAGWWPRGMEKPTVILYFSSSGLLLLYSVYSLSWGRAYTDELTGQANRRALEEALNHLGRRYAVAMVDIDHFKKFNDTYGHDVGDDVLRFVASRMAREGIGKVYRYGGEEFTILCPRKRAESLQDPLDDLREKIARSRLVIRGRTRDRAMRGRTGGGAQKKVFVTISIGVAERNEKQLRPEQVIQAADKALYAAKKGGRNRVVVSQ